MQKITAAGGVWIALSLCLFLLLLILFSGYNGYFGQDAYEYLHLARGVHAYFFDGLPVPHSVFPVLYPCLGFLFSLILRNDMFALQLVSVFAAAGAFLYLRKLWSLFWPLSFRSDAYLLLFFSFSPYVLRFSVTAMSDLANLFFCIAALYFFVLFCRELKKRSVVYFALFASLAVYTRDASVIFLFLPVCIVLFRLVQGKDYRAVLLLLAVFAVVSLPSLVLQQRILFFDLGGQGQAGGYLSGFGQWSPLNLFRHRFYDNDGLQQYPLPNIVFIFFPFVHPGFIFCGLLLLIFVRRDDLRSRYFRIALLVYMFYALCIGGFPYQNVRYMLPAFPLVLFLYYPAFGRLVHAARRFRRQALYAFVTVLLLQSALFVYASRVLYVQNRNEQRIALAVRKYPGPLLYTCTIEGALDAYGVRNPTVSLYNTRLDHVDSGALLLFNYGDFSRQFAGRNPMYNWTFLQSRDSMRVLEDLPGGWKLYALEPRND